jgi:uncharacterized membrane protein
MKIHKIIISVALFAIFGAIMAYGVSKGDFFTTMLNGGTL